MAIKIGGRRQYCGIKGISVASKRFTAKARRLGHTLHIAGRGKDYKTYQCNKCKMLGTIEPNKMYGPLLTKRCPGKIGW